MEKPATGKFEPENLLINMSFLALSTVALYVLKIAERLQNGVV